VTTEAVRVPRTRQGPPAPVVGIGASAGGLRAFEAFFAGMPVDADTGLAFVVVQHLSPDHASILADLVRRHTRMDVFEVEDGMEVRPDCTYVIPPNRSMAYEAGRLRLSTPAAPRGRRLPIDFLFRTLAAELGEQAIGIVLSGAGSDGTEGLRAIKLGGGLVIAQRPETAEVDSMPRSAIAAGIVDMVLAPAEMPSHLLGYATRAFTARSSARGPARRGREPALASILGIVHTDSGHDFTGYKPATMMRRIERRMAINHVDTLDHYLDLLRGTPGEADSLARDLLIGVTTFFRDPDAFDALRRRVVAPVVAASGSETAIRVWVPACSTGEEAYSIAILFREEMDAQARSAPVQVFATDIDGDAVAKARTGLYPPGIAADVSTERLARHFVEEPGGNGYRVGRSLRDMVVFSEHDITRDPPFSRLDLVSSRNVMIYMGPQLRDRVLSVLHYSLLPGGALFLGTSESLGEQHHLFTTVDRAARIFRRPEEAGGEGPVPSGHAPAGATDWRHWRPDGSPTPGLVPPSRELAEGASPAPEVPDAAVADDAGDPDATGRAAENAVEQVARLERELRASEAYLRSATQELEHANADLTSTNEELQSVNEELQSVNEELETSQEELQSVNEELATTNAELQAAVGALTRTNNDLSNLVAGTGVATLFVDLDLRIGRFTPGIAEILNLIPGDTGRPLGQVVSNLVGHEQLTGEVRAVLDTLVPREAEVRTEAGAWYLMGIRPYRTLENLIEGAVLTFTDTSELKRAEAVVREADGLRRRAAVIHDAGDAIVVHDDAGRILAWNPAAIRLLGWTEEEALALDVRDLVPEDRRPDFVQRTGELARASVLEPRRAGWRTRDGRTVQVTLVSTRLVDAAGVPYATSSILRAIDPAPRDEHEPGAGGGGDV